MLSKWNLKSAVIKSVKPDLHSEEASKKRPGRL